MPRDIEPPEPRQSDRDSASLPSPTRLQEQPSRERQPYIGRNYAYVLSDSEIKTLADIGRFRTVPIEDLVRYRYQGRADEMREDLRAVQNQGLVQRRTVWKGGRGEKLTVLVLSKKGQAFLEQAVNGTKDQKIFSGFVKPSEVHHDAAIYRMYQTEARKIEAAGGEVKRTILDYELKQDVYKPLARTRATFAPESPEYRRQQAEIAAQNKLRIVDGKILLPDLRIEYATASGERTHVDLELATRHYRGSSMRAKAEAGFKMYAAKDSAGGLAAAFDPEFAAEIFSF